MVMGGGHDHNDVEGLLSQDALFVAQGGRLAFQPDNPTQIANGDFEAATGNHFTGWGFQDDEGVTSFADHAVAHGGKTSLRMENIGKNPAQHCRIMQQIKLQPHRQYRISFWVKTEGLSGPTPEVKVLAADTGNGISYQTFHTEPTQDWTHYDLVFNSLNNSLANLYLGSWWGKEGKIWWDDLSVQEIALVNVLRRPGCPVTVRSETGTPLRRRARLREDCGSPASAGGIAYHDPPVVKLTPNTRIQDGERLRVSFYHPVIIYADRVTFCLSEPRVFADWREEVQTANRALPPGRFSHAA